MAIFEIPTRNDIYIYTFQTELENETYTFKIHLNKRLNNGEGTWVLDIPNVLYSVPLLRGNDIFQQFHYLDGVPPGEMKLIDLDNEERDPNITTFSDRLVIGYSESV